MKLEQATVRKIKISEVHGIDPIHVFLEDFEPGKGKITISCYDKSWHSYWGGMSDRTIDQFFISCDNHYLAKNLSCIRSSVNDYEALAEKIKDYYGCDIDFYVLDEMSALYGDQNDGEHWVRENIEIMEEVFGCDWYYDIPTKENPRYRYLCNIINTVKKALVKYNGPNFSDRNIVNRG
ncbi:hypothetical protein [Kangiella sp.]|uniref:hypothetical protein n=1 Tax=Kangiella sp. TaxID=1920245 RepID=UPI003A916183